MRYHPALDSAPSSVSSTLFAITGSFASMLGCIFILFRLHRIRKSKGYRWQTRHYLICIMAATNLVMTTTALISGGFFLVFGRIASAAGCTIGGMIEFWAQQAVDICSVLVTIATFASFRYNTLWAQKQYWIQTNMAPVVGTIVFLPLVGAIVTQIIWKFRSSEFTYCWVPRMPVYARWIAIDGWRTLIVLGIIVAYTYIACAIYRARKYRNSAFVVGSNDVALPSTKQPAAVAILRHTAIDSEPSSKATNDGRGLFSQSIHNIQYWALSKLGRSNYDGATCAGLREKLDTAAVSNINGPVYKTVDYYTIGTQHVAQTQQENTYDYFTSDTNKQSPALSKAKTSRNYYEQFKRSFVHNIVRRFTITTIIPSPTISEGIFDNICKSNESHIMSSSNTHCDICSSIGSITASKANSIGNICYRESSQFDCQSIGPRQAGLRRWYSALARLITKPTQYAIGGITAKFPHDHRLRRSHTAPVLSHKEMGLCNCIFKRPQSPAIANNSMSDNMLGLSSETALSPSQQKTLAATYKYPRKPGPIHHAAMRQVERSYSVKERANTINSIRSASIASTGLPDKIQEIFGHALYDYKGQKISQPNRVSVYACANYSTSSNNSSSTSSSDESARIANIRGVERFSSLEEGNWAAIVGSCRSDREVACQNRQLFESEYTDNKSAYRISRLFVYPLAYAIVWIPSLIYYIISTYVYYTAFESPNTVVHHRRSVDMSSMPAHWTLGQNANRAWPYYRHASSDVWGSSQLYWLAIIQALHLLNGAIDALLFWATESH